MLLGATFRAHSADLQGKDLDIYVDKRAMIEKADAESYGMAGVTGSVPCRAVYESFNCDQFMTTSVTSEEFTSYMWSVPATAQEDEGSVASVHPRKRAPPRHRDTRKSRTRRR